MSISLAGRGVSSVDGLSALGRLTLSFIDGGLEWLEWATNSLTARYEFPDETSLVDGIQQGLHASGLVLLPRLGLVAGPAKLMSLGLTDLRTLAMAETGDSSDIVTAQLRRVLSDHALVSCHDLTACATFLKQLGVADSVVFQSITFDEQLAIWELLTVPGDDSGSTASTSPTDVSQGVEPIQLEAAKFAVEQCRTPAEFVDYYRFYLVASAKVAKNDPSTPEQRLASVTRVMQTLLPVLFASLDCPRISGLPVPAQVAIAAADWIAQGKQIGFARLSEAAYQVVRFSTYRDETADAATQIVNQYLRSAQAFLSGNAVRRARMGQDGASCSFAFESQSLRALLLLSSTGTISLRDFCSIPKS
jgi:hypothetical protein